jgi:large subunit ribosomal protein L41e
MSTTREGQRELVEKGGQGREEVACLLLEQGRHKCSSWVAVWDALLSLLQECGGEIALVRWLELFEESRFSSDSRFSLLFFFTSFHSYLRSSTFNPSTTSTPTASPFLPRFSQLARLAPCLFRQLKQTDSLSLYSMRDKWRKKRVRRLKRKRRKMRARSKVRPVPFFSFPPR